MNRTTTAPKGKITIVTLLVPILLLLGAGYFMAGIVSGRSPHPLGVLTENSVEAKS